MAYKGRNMFYKNKRQEMTEIGDVMPPHLFQEGFRSTSDGYVDLLNTVVKPWIRRVANVLWAPNSPDLNPMDYFVWGAVEKDTNRSPSNTKAQLMDKIKTVFAALPRETVASACSRFRSRIEAVIDANGGYFDLSVRLAIRHKSCMFYENRKQETTEIRAICNFVFPKMFRLSSAVISGIITS
ncbi:hypothetical protein AAG570_004598 [Ranatra chinensis]|uniref:Uncharacterized protein n=1 Tax=Ranatra chinensis TaxID=642074 RepID=A0ABD0Y1C2_9HEMI